MMYLTYGVMFGIGSSFIYSGSLVILGHYFKKRMSLVNGIVTTGSAIFTIGLIGVCIVLGMMDGCFICLLGPIVFDLVGAKNASQAMGFLFAVISIPIMTGPMIGECMYEPIKFIHHPPKPEIIMIDQEPLVLALDFS
ncbi:SLC16A10 [Bugula neritina]|uniref:SLC16A10 n=1 Tax=Bugula neritina TaxID=10212 RepID=A0A7J7KTL7_BUGNE|nr:SLC16A10 [Bugula neritina]